MVGTRPVGVPRSEYNPSTLRLGRSSHCVPKCLERLRGVNAMKNPLDSLWGTIISGLVLTVILYFVVKSLITAAA